MDKWSVISVRTHGPADPRVEQGRHADGAEITVTWVTGPFKETRAIWDVTENA